MKGISVSPEAKNLGIRNPNVALLRLNGDPMAPVTWDDTDLEWQDWPCDPATVRGYQRLLAKVGYPDVTPAGEKLRELVRSKGLKPYGLLVDAVNIVSLRYGAGIGLHGISQGYFNGLFQVWTAEGTERVVPSFSSKAKTVPWGDLLYGVAQGEQREVMAWLGRRDCDAMPFQLTSDSREALVVVLGNDATTAAYSKSLIDEIVALVRSKSDVLQSIELLETV